MFFLSVQVKISFFSSSFPSFTIKGEGGGKGLFPSWPGRQEEVLGPLPTPPSYFGFIGKQREVAQIGRQGLTTAEVMKRLQ
jgi:hypothetical protein